MKYTLNIYESKPDMYGNSYFAFSFYRHCDSATVTGTTSGGLSNIESVKYEFTGDSVLVTRDTLQIREFNKVTKGYPHAGCLPADIAFFIVSRLPVPPQMGLRDLLEAMNAAYPDREAVAALYNEHFNAAIEKEGFTPAQAQIIAGRAYEDGHSAGYNEVVSVAFGLCEFASRLLETR